MDTFAKTLAGVAALVAVMPGIAAMKSPNWIPPESGELFGAVSVGVSAIVALVCLAFAKRTAALSWKRFVRQIAGGLVAAAMLISAYWTLFDQCVVPEQAPDGQVTRKWLFPLLPAGDLAARIDYFDGSRVEVANRESDLLPRYLGDQGWRIGATRAVLCLLYTGAMSTLVAGLCIAGTRRPDESCAVGSAPQATSGACQRESLQ